jgi:hypothetical protein
LDLFFTDSKVHEPQWRDVFDDALSISNDVDFTVKFSVSKRIRPHDSEETIFLSVETDSIADWHQKTTFLLHKSIVGVGQVSVVRVKDLFGVIRDPHLYGIFVMVVVN